MNTWYARTPALYYIRLAAEYITFFSDRFKERPLSICTHHPCSFDVFIKSYIYAHLVMNLATFFVKLPRKQIIFAVEESCLEAVMSIWYVDSFKFNLIEKDFIKLLLGRSISTCGFWYLLRCWLDYSFDFFY